jgi:hypothetical protein
MQNIYRPHKTTFQLGGNILTEFGTSIELITLIKMHSNETDSKVLTCKHGVL